MDFGLKDKVVLVTGASRGIGKAIVEAFANEGSHLVLCARNQQELDSLADEIKQKGGKALAVAADMAKTEDIKHAVDAAIDTFSTIHVLVNNAGMIGSGGAFDTLSDEEWAQVFEVNLFSMVKLIRMVVPYMQRQHWGRIINLSSESGIQPDPDMADYNATKAAIINLSKSLSKTYAKDGVLVNTVSPAFIKTPMVDQMLGQQAKAQNISPEEAERRFLQQNRPHIELGRAGTAEEVAPAVVFLASQQASFINGENLRVDGGSVASI